MSDQSYSCYKRFKDSFYYVSRSTLQILQKSPWSALDWHIHTLVDIFLPLESELSIWNQFFPPELFHQFLFLCNLVILSERHCSVDQVQMQWLLSHRTFSLIYKSSNDIVIIFCIFSNDMNKCKIITKLVKKKKFFFLYYFLRWWGIFFSYLSFFWSLLLKIVWIKQVLVHNLKLKIIYKTFFVLNVFHLHASCT